MLRLPAQQGQPGQTPGHVVGLLKDQEEGLSEAHALGARLSSAGWGQGPSCSPLGSSAGGLPRVFGHLTGSCAWLTLEPDLELWPEAQD